LAHIKAEEFDKAIQECKESFKIDPKFTKSYKRFCQATIPLGYLSECRGYLKYGIEKQGL
jgi:hypothetical protein